ncbi:TPA: hypothetical protein VDB83_001219 [Burkholderia cenocepacia]|uniref:hypothetical protein n=1 Tax=Burkholderia cenocepacia TaxID=95486 RepID=UPI001B8E840F|nr:hypothetical protein [Burkholderia cenocepacia]MBR8096379.1 hypothetical protein [Burkholderia cenocepacia]HEP6426948.1 hypothetical protein [Burkholderia cenocepacia]
MIDISKMKALAARLRGPINKFDNTAAAYSESAQAIEDLLSELEAREADRRDAERYRIIRDTLSKAVGGGVEMNDERLVYQEPVPGEEVRIFWYPYTPVGFSEVHGADLDSAADALALAQRQEGEEK